jgi:hypothetical protein
LNYADFLTTKDYRIEAAGFESGPLNPLLYPFQRDIVRWAVRQGRAAIFADCGMGKTFMQVEWARQIAAVHGPARAHRRADRSRPADHRRGAKLGITVESALEPVRRWSMLSRPSSSRTTSACTSSSV